MLNRTFIVAECGINHMGNLSYAKKLVDVAIEANVDAVKFQTYFGSQKGFEKFEFTKSQWTELIGYCECYEIKWFSTPFDFEAIDFLNNDIGMYYWKIPSGLVRDFAHLGKIRSINPSFIIISTGMANEEDISNALEVLKPKAYCILHCISKYPTPMEEVNLTKMAELVRRTNGRYGLSDHTQGIEVPIAAVALGAKIIEKHITLDRNMDGPDHNASLEPDELKQMVKCIRNVELAL